MSVAETPELWRMIFADIKAFHTQSWQIIWHLYAQSDNELTAAQLAKRVHIPETGVLRLMNHIGRNVARRTGWFTVESLADGWHVLFTRRLSRQDEWLYSIRQEFLPILGEFKREK